MYQNGITRPSIRPPSAQPALYEAMFSQPIAARFAVEDNEAELRAGFDALAQALGDEGDGAATEA
jgi:hypothetical protein